MTQPLNDPQQQPDKTILRSALGDNYANFARLQSLFEQRGAVGTWNYYNDGKNWLYKVQHEQKTIVWLSVWKGYFKLSFYFTEKTRPGIGELGINAQIEAALSTQKPAGKLIPLILDIRDKTLLNDVEQLINYKITCR